MTIEIRIVIDPFAGAGPVPKRRSTKEELEEIKRELAKQREIDEQYRQRAMERHLLRQQNELGEK
jgi:hypothetical protein